MSFQRIKKAAGITYGCALALVWFGGFALAAPFVTAWQALREGTSSMQSLAGGRLS